MTLFLSAASADLKEWRDVLHGAFSRAGFRVLTQEQSLGAAPGDVYRLLTQHLDESDCIIHLAGMAYGSDAEPAFAEMPGFQCSWTQFEYYYAHSCGKDVIAFVCAPDLSKKDFVEEVKDNADGERKKRLQEEHRERVRLGKFDGTPLAGKVGRTLNESVHTFADLLKAVAATVRTLTKLGAPAQKLKADLVDMLARSAPLHANASNKSDSLQDSLKVLQDIVTIRALDSATRDAAKGPKLPYNLSAWPAPAPFHNLTVPSVGNFVGRDEVLADVSEKLSAGKSVALTQPTAMHGTGGVGKTRAAIEFARAHRGEFSLVLFLDAQSPEALTSSLAQASQLLDLEGAAEAKPDAQLLLTLRLLRAVPSALVVADNVDTPAALAAQRPLLARPGGVRWLLTSRLTEWGDEFHKTRVDRLPSEASIQLLQNLARRDGHNPGPDADAEKVAAELGHLPLALHQAAAYVRRQHLQWSAYTALLDANPTEALRFGQNDLKSSEESVLRTYAISVRQLSDLARLFLQVGAVVAAAPIPEGVFFADDTIGFPSDEAKGRAALDELVSYSLITWASPDVIIHRAVAIATRVELHASGRLRGAMEAACQAITFHAPEDPQHPSNWPEWMRLRLHIETLLGSEALREVDVKKYVWLVDTFPLFLIDRGEHALAGFHFRTAQRLGEQMSGKECQGALRNRNNLASTLLYQGKHAEAEAEHREVMAIQLRAQGPEHPETLKSRINLSNALLSQGKHAEAETEYRGALAIQERVLGPEHPDTLTCRMNLASSLRSQGKHAEAEAEHRAVLLIRERVMGLEHPDTLRSRMNLTNALCSQGNHVEAEAEYRVILAIQERVLGAEHPSTLNTCHNLTFPILAQGKKEEALAFAQRAVQGRRTALGPEHPDIKIAERRLKEIQDSLSE